MATQDARQRVLTERAHLWKDPESIQGASIGETHPCHHTIFVGGGRMVDAPASCICLELNAKNSYGGYTGLKRTVAVFPETGETHIKDGAYSGFEEYCRNMKPFPELNGRIATR
jgi:hypothetical protein